MSRVFRTTVDRTVTSVFLGLILLSSSAVFSPSQGQLPATRQEAVRMLQQDPEAVRQRLRESGMSQAEIRARLASAGLPANSLDDFLPGAAPGTVPGFDSNTFAALETLGVLRVTPDGVEIVPVLTGMQAAEEELPDSMELPVFGQRVFSRASSQFQPLLYGPVPDDYRLGPGDQMVLVLTGEVELARELTVSRDGLLIIPDVGQIAVTNVTIAELRTILRQRLARAYSGIDRGATNFEITVTQLRTIQVYVSGEVAQPGAYQLASVATSLNALYAAGGPTELGNLRTIRISRRTGETFPVDLYPYLLEGDVSSDIRLEQGDAIFVPLTARRVKVVGEVGRPAIYELAESDDLFDALAAAGGFGPEADRSRLTIHRVARPGDRGPGLTDRVAIDLGLAAATDPESPNQLGGVTVPPVGLQDGDSIFVGSVPALDDSYYVTINGMVQQAGNFPWREGLTLRDLVLLARGPTVGADLREAEVTRLPSDRATGDLAERLRVPLDSSYLSQRDPLGRYVGAAGLPFPPSGSAPEFTLEPFDNITILRQPDFEMPQTVVISGEVRVPGRYTLLSKDDRVSSLVDRAEGILTTAYPQGARLIRTLDGLGRIDMDLPEALSNRGGPNDLVLQPGDSLHIPVYSPTVVVQGAVNSPVTVLYRTGEPLSYYIANAGGYRHDADRGRLSVRYANGQAETRSRFLFWSSYPAPGPGSVVSVPAKTPEDRFDTAGFISDMVAIVGSIATVAIVITR